MLCIFQQLTQALGQTIPLLLGGLTLFIYAIFQLSNTLKGTFSEKAKTLVKKFTRNIFLAILIGTVITIILDSSSAVIIMTIVFVNGGLLTFRQTMGIVMGANIGTTISSQIIALDVGKYSVIPLIIGLILYFAGRTDQLKKTGRILLFFGMLFFGLFVMEYSMEPLTNSHVFEEWIASLENPVQGAFIGGLVTLIIQSSSATVGIAITLGKQNLIGISGGIAVMLGAELGTCSDTLIATIKGSRQALKTGLFHLFYSLVTIIIGLIAFTPFVEFIKLISAGQGIDNHIANAHLVFNLFGVAIFLPFLPLIERIMNWMIPEKTVK
jgi:phosphate:Na+ symporter